MQTGLLLAALGLIGLVLARPAGADWNRRGYNRRGPVRSNKNSQKTNVQGGAGPTIVNKIIINTEQSSPQSCGSGDCNRGAHNATLAASGGAAVQREQAPAYPQGGASSSFAADASLRWDADLIKNAELSIGGMTDAEIEEILKQRRGQQGGHLQAHPPRNCGLNGCPMEAGGHLSGNVNFQGAHGGAHSGNSLAGHMGFEGGWRDQAADLHRNAHLEGQAGMRAQFDGHSGAQNHLGGQHGGQGHAGGQAGLQGHLEGHLDYASLAALAGLAGAQGQHLGANSQGHLSAGLQGHLEGNPHLPNSGVHPSMLRALALKAANKWGADAATLYNKAQHAQGTAAQLGRHAGLQLKGQLAENLAGELDCHGRGNCGASLAFGGGGQHGGVLGASGHGGAALSGYLHEDAAATASEQFRLGLGGAFGVAGQGQHGFKAQSVGGAEFDTAAAKRALHEEAAQFQLAAGRRHTGQFLAGGHLLAAHGAGGSFAH